MASILLTTNRSEGVPLILRLVQEGHICKFYSDQNTEVLSGYQNPMKLTSMRMLEQFDFVLNGCPGNATLIEGIRTKNLFTLGGGSFTDVLNEDHRYQREVIQKVMNLHPWKGEDGIFLGITGWFGSKKDFSQYNYYVNYERMYEEERGAISPSMGSCVWLGNGEDRFVRAILNPLIPLLKNTGYFGPVNVDFVFDEKNIWVKSLSACFLYDSTQALIELMKKGFFSFLWSMYQGHYEDLLNQYALSVRFSLPPYPFEADWNEMYEGEDYLGIPEGARNHLFLNNVQMKDGKETFAPIDGNLGCATARGKEIKEARTRVYRTLGNIIGDPIVQYRKDIGAGIEHIIEQAKVMEWMNA